MHSQYSYPIHQCNPLEIPKGLAFLGVSLQQNTVVAEVLLLKTFPWKACHERKKTMHTETESFIAQSYHHCALEKESPGSQKTAVFPYRQED